MAEVKRPHKRAHGDVERGFKDCYAADEADAYIAALERRLRIAERAIDTARLSTPYTPKSVEFYLERAEREIDSE